MSWRSIGNVSNSQSSALIKFQQVLSKIKYSESGIKIKAGKINEASGRGGESRERERERDGESERDDKHFLA